MALVTALLDIILTSEFFFSILRVSTPIIFAAMGMVVANNAGIPNLALEGTMLISAFLGMLVGSFTNSAAAGLMGALLGGIACAGLLAFFTLRYRANVVLGGIAINVLASGGTVFFLYLYTGDKGTSASIAGVTLPHIDIPVLKSIPVLGAVFSGHHILTYIALLSAAFVYVFLKHTPMGFHLRAVGENPDAARSVGINTVRVKTLALLISGLLAGMGGAFMSMGYVSWFARDMIAGRGWIAIAAEAMGRSTVIGTFLTSLLFGAADAFSNAAGTMGMPSELVRTIPYCATLLGLILFSVRAYRKGKTSSSL